MNDQNDPNDTAERIANSVAEQEAEGSQSRRGFLSRSALAGGALLALAGGTGISLADQHEDDGATFQDVDGTDVDVLNYALTLELFESELYEAGLDEFDEGDLEDSDLLEEYNEEALEEVYAHFEMIAEQEAAHADVLGQAVSLLGGEPVEPGPFEFEFESFEEFVTLARTVENVGVGAYAGAAPYIESPDLLSAALSIHSVEARHAAMLNTLLGGSPFPDAFDAARSQDEVTEVLSTFMPEEEPTDDEGTDTDEPNGTDTDEPNGT
ncbi:MAG: ferritin-like domain-containing protein, partial [Halolamina sp.]